MAKTSMLAENLEKELECAVCLEQFKDPKVLPCLHSFCKICLEGLVGRKGNVWELNCPSCRISIELPDGKVDSLPVNFFLNNLLSLVSLHGDSDSCNLECDICDNGDPPVNRCATCSHFLCEFCSQAHKRGRNTKSHSLVSLEEAKKMGSVAVTKPSVCKEHNGEVLKLFCDTCDEVICRDCTIVKHREHKYTFVKDVFVEKKESMLKILSQTKGKALLLKEALNGVSEMKRSVELNAEQTIQEVINTFQKRTACLNARCEELIHGVLELQKVKQKSLEVQQEELESALCSVQSSVEFTEKALENGSEVEILSMRKKMSSRLQEVNSAIWQLEPRAHDVFRFHADDQLDQVLASYGTITDMCTDAGTSTITMGHGLEGLMYSTIIRQPVEFTVTAKAKNGMKCQKGGDQCEVQICAGKGGHKFSDVAQFSAKDVGNGTYSFNFTPNDEEMKYKLSVELNGFHVKGSSCIWHSERWQLCKEENELCGTCPLIQLDKDSRVATYVACEEIPKKVNRDRLNRTQFKGQVHNTAWNKRVAGFLLGDNPEGFCKSNKGGDYGVVVEYRTPTKKWMERLTVFGTSSFHVGKHSWKAKMSGDVSTGFSFGVRHVHREEYPRKWMWEAGNKYEGFSYQKSTLTNCIYDDIIEFYLDCDNRTLTMYNQHTKESDTWKTVEGKVCPMFEMSKDKQEVSLIL